MGYGGTCERVYGETLGNDLVLADAPHQSWSDRLGVALADSWVGKQVAKHLAPQGPAVEKDFEDLPTDVNLVDMLGRTLDLMQARIEREIRDEIARRFGSG